MRRHVWLGIIGAVVLAGCDKPKVQSTDAAPVTEAPTAEATPPPAVAQATPESAPPAPASAGPKVDDEVFLIRRMSIPIDGGMRGFREGAKVKVVAIDGSKLTVLGNGVQFDVQTADISVTPPVVQSAPPAPAATSTAGTGAGAKPPTLTASEVEKKKMRNNISAEISNLQSAYNRLNASNEQIQARINQMQDLKYSGSRSTNSPEARAREAEINRLYGVIRKQSLDAVQVQKAMRLKERELSRLD